MGQNDDLFACLCRAASAVNYLAHQLGGANRGVGFQVKSELCSAVLMGFEDQIKVNGIRGGILGLDLTDSVRLHCPITALRPEARAIARRKARSAPAVSPIRDLLNPAQLQGLASLQFDN